MNYYGAQPFAAVPGGGFGVNGSTTATMPQPAALGGWPASPQSEALRQQAATHLQRCYHWLEEAVRIVPQTADLVPALVMAVQQYEARQYEACLAQVAVVIRTVRQVRLTVPTLPPL